MSALPVIVCCFVATFQALSRQDQLIGRATNFPVWKIVDDVIGAEGRDEPDNAHVFDLIRSDPATSAGGETRFQPHSELTFRQLRGSAIVNGTLLVTPLESSRVLASCAATGLSIIGLHKYFGPVDSDLISIHVEGIGTGGSLASAVKAALAETAGQLTVVRGSDGSLDRTTSTSIQIAGVRSEESFGAQILKIHHVHSILVDGLIVQAEAEFDSTVEILSKDANKIVVAGELWIPRTSVLSLLPILLGGFTIETVHPGFQHALPSFLVIHFRASGISGPILSNLQRLLLVVQTGGVPRA